MKPVITIDIDNVVFAHNGLGGFGVQIYGMFTNLIDALVGAMPRGLTEMALGAASRSAHLAETGIPYCIRLMSESYDPHFLSARPAYAAGSVANMFADNGIEIPRDRLAFAPSGDKAVVAVALGSILHIDDSASVIQSMIKIGMGHCLISNDKTKYNHYLRARAKWAENLVAASLNLGRFLS